MVSIDPVGTPIVGAKEVKVPFISRIVEALYGVIDPLHRYADFALYAYNMDDVLTSRSCESFGDVPADHEFAFVSPVDQSKREKKFVGVRVTEAAEIHEICNTVKRSGQVLADELDKLLFTTEAQDQLLGVAKYQVIEDNALKKSVWNRQCVKPFVGGITQSLPAKLTTGGGAEIVGFPAGLKNQYRIIQEGFDTAKGSSKSYASAHSVVESLGQLSETWGSEVSDEVVKVGIDRLVLEEIYREMAKGVSASPPPRVWKVQPEGAERLAGQFFMTVLAVEGVADAAAKIHGDDTDTGFMVTFWYEPPFCRASEKGKWYVMSDRPLRYVKSEFRSGWASLGVGGRQQ